VGVENTAHVNTVCVLIIIIIIMAFYAVVLQQLVDCRGANSSVTYYKSTPFKSQLFTFQASIQEFKL